MTLLRLIAAAPARPPLTRAPLSADPLPALADPTPPWPGREYDLPGIQLHVRETPGPADGPPVVYVHGLGGSARNWTELAGQLSGRAHGFALDMPGFGRSKPLMGHRPTLDSMAEIVIQAITKLCDGPVHLVGNSMGGSIALLVAAGRPDLVRTLTLISPAMPDLRPDFRRLSDPRMVLAYLPVIGRRARRALAATTPRERAERLLRLCFAEPERISDGRLELAVEEYTEQLTKPWAGTALVLATNALLRAWLRFGRNSLWKIANTVATPALVVWGEADRLVTVRKAPRTAKALPNARLLVLRNTGHVAQMERPDTVARAILGLWDGAATGEW